MASMLCLSNSNLVVRSFRSTVVSASRCLSIHAGRRDYTTMPKDDSYEQSWPRMLSPNISSMSSQVDISAKWRHLEMYKPESEDRDTYKGLRVNLYMPGLKQEDMRTCAQHKLPYMTTSDIKKDDVMANLMCKLIAGIRDITMDTFYDRPVLGKGSCPLIARPLLPDSFSIYMTETDKNLETILNMHGTIKLNTHSLCVSLYMYGPYEVKRKDVKTFFVNNTLFIEVKTKGEHRLTCIYLPERIRKKHNMIKRQVKDNVFYAMIACSVKKEELKDQLKRIANYILVRTISNYDIRV